LAFNLAPLTGTGRFYPDADLLHTALGRVLGNIDFEVRVEIVQAPIFYGNALSLACQLDTEVGGDIILKALQGQPGLEVMDSAPMEFCGTISAPEFETVPVSIMHMSGNGCFSLWSIIDNLRKGSALNAVQTAEMYIAG
jgi:aspartate-semialdehyde dehydrogenase